MVLAVLMLVVMVLDVVALGFVLRVGVIRSRTRSIAAETETKIRLQRIERKLAAVARKIGAQTDGWE